MKFAAWVLVGLARVASADDLDVPGDFASIQAAIDAAAPGDLVSVGPGLWRESLDFLGKDVRVVSALGSESTVLDGGGASVVVRFAASNGPATELRGFQVTGGGRGISVGGAFGAAGGAPTISDCVVAFNDSGGLFGWGCSARIDDCVFANNGGPGVELQWEGNARLRNCLIRDNAASFFGSGIYADEGARVRAIHCTIVGNTGQPGVYTTFEAEAELVNCIVRDNPAGQVVTGVGYLDVSFSNVEGGIAGVGNLDVDAQFVDAAANDYRLRSSSPCVDAGTLAVELPPTDLFGDPRVANGAPDLGCDEYLPLQGDDLTLSLSSGDVLTLRLDAGEEAAGEVYFVLASLTGSSPVVALPGADLPLVPDGWFAAAAQHVNQPPYAQSLAFLDGDGVGTCTLSVPSIDLPALVGTNIWHAYLRFGAGLAITGASNPLRATFVD